MFSEITGGSFLTGDVIFLIAAFLVLVAYGTYFGKGRLVSLVLAFFPAVALYEIFPYTDKLTVFSGSGGTSWNQILIFLVFFIPLNILVNKYVFASPEYSKTSGLMKSAGVALSGVILFMIFSYTVINLDGLHNFSANIDNLFTSGDREFWWSVASLALLAFF